MGTPQAIHRPCRPIAALTLGLFVGFGCAPKAGPPVAVDEAFLERIGQRPAPAVEVAAETAVPPVQRIAIRQAGGLAIVDVHVNGRGPYPFVLDTGTSRTVLDRSIVNEPGRVYPSTENDVVSAFASTYAPEFFYAVDLLELGTMRVEAIECPVFDLSFLRQHTGEQVRGVLGFAFFAEQSFAIELPDNYLSVIDVAPPAPDRHAVHLPYRLVNDRPMVRGRVGEYEVDLLIDTGAVATLSVPEHIFEQLIGNAENVETGVSRTFKGSVHDRRNLHRLVTIHLGEMAMEVDMVHETPLAHGVIGGEILQSLSLTFDADRRILTIVPRRNVRAVPGSSPEG